MFSRKPPLTTGARHCCCAPPLRDRLSSVAEGSGLYSISGTGSRNEGLPDASVAAGCSPALANSEATHSAAASSPGCSDMRPSRPSPAMKVRLERRSPSRIALKPVCRRGATGCCAKAGVLTEESRRYAICSERKEGLIAPLWHESPRIYPSLVVVFLFVILFVIP